MKLNTIDIHAHLTDARFDTDREEVILRMEEGEVGAITVGTDYESSKQAVELSERYPNIWACVGVHPEDGSEEVFDAERYRALADSKRVVAIGECGFDYFRKPKSEVYKTQLELFEAQIVFAGERALPLMLHLRSSKGSFDAYEDALSVLSSYQKTFPNLTGNAHFFAGDTKLAQKFFDLNFSISFTGVISFASEYEEVLAYASLSHIHAETDSPYVAPKPYRGERNEPLYVTEVIKRIAEIKKLPQEEVEAQLFQNARALFGTS